MVSRSRKCRGARISRNHFMSTHFEAIAKKQGLSLSGRMGRTSTDTTTERHDTRDNGQVRQQRAQCDMMMVVHLLTLSVVQRRTPSAMRCSAPSSTSEVRMPELAARQSAPSQAARLAWRVDASAMAQSTGSSGTGSGSMCLEKSSSREWSAAASVTMSRNSALLPAR